MTTFKTYQEAKITNPDREIFTNPERELFSTDSSVPLFVKCNPADYCMTVEQFLKDGYEFVEGDLVFNAYPRKKIDKIEYGDLIDYNIPDCDDDKRYVLRAVALKDESNNSELPNSSEWNNGDELPPIGCKVMTSFTESDCDNWCDFHVPSEIIAYHGDYVWVAHHGKFNRVHALSDIEFEKPETPEQKAERERLKAAIELHDIAQDAYFEKDGGRDGSATWDKSPDRVKNMYLAIVDKTGYKIS